MAASGVEDSPRAKRGCRCRSRRSTRCPCPWRMRARIDPAKPEPTMAIFMRPPKDPKDCKDDKDLVGAALRRPPGWGGVSPRRRAAPSWLGSVVGKSAAGGRPPSQGDHMGPPLHSPPADRALPPRLQEA